MEVILVEREVGGMLSVRYNSLIRWDGEPCQTLTCSRLNYLSLKGGKKIQNKEKYQNTALPLCIYSVSQSLLSPSGREQLMAVVP